MAGDRAGSVKARMDATALQIGRARDLVGRGQAAQKRIEDPASQIAMGAESALPPGCRRGERP